MDLMPNNERILGWLKQLQLKALNTHHRFLVVLSGDEPWVKSTLAFQLSHLPECASLIVTDIATSGNYTNANKLKNYLGSETERIVWDGFSGLNPDGFGAASGLLKGGGLFFLLLPTLTKLTRTPDPDYIRMCSHNDDLEQCGTRFLQRMVDLIKSDSDVLLFEQQPPLLFEQQSPLSKNDAKQSLNFKPGTSINLPSADQIKMIEAIKSVAKGHRKRPLVIHADRGRGKSSALGIAAAKIINEHSLKVLITAPSRLACISAFQHAGSFKEKSCALEFIAPDVLVETTPSCHLLMVDEAAAIPSALLKQMLSVYPRIVFATTVHGYEGNGQGFAVRFRKELDLQTPQWKSLSLKQPIRWADEDPLERWVFNFLLLDAQLTRVDQPTFESHSLEPDHQKTDALEAGELDSNSGPQSQVLNAHTRWVKQDEFMSSHPLLNDITALLVLAHYQTSPSDIRLLLDHPKVHIAIIEELGPKQKGPQQKSPLLGVALLIEEGGVSDTKLAQAIFEGRRRPRGQLIPQSLVTSTGAFEFLTHRTYRVMRIAVHPDFTHQGLGSALIEAAKKYSSQNNVDSLSTSFGITPELLRFWHKNGFGILKVGTHKDGASGTQSAIMLLPLSNRATQLSLIYTKQFIQNFLLALSKHYRYLSADNVFAILDNLSYQVSDPANSIAPIASYALTEKERNQLKAYAEQYRSFEDSMQVLSKLILACFADNSIKILSSQNSALLVIRVFQGRSIQTCVRTFNLEGKKQLERLLKTSVMTLLD